MTTANQTSRTGRRNIALRHDLIDSLVMILRIPASTVRAVAKGMSDASLHEWIETEMQSRQVA
jgi:hypothetical protein